MTKQELRKKYKELRTQLSSEDINKKSIAIANIVLKLPIWDAEFYHVFLTIEQLKEVETEPILSILSGKDKHIVLSKTEFKTTSMKHFLLTDNTTIKTNSWNIPEPVNGIEIQPEKIDVVFVPLLAFDSKGNRVGYGKGFYDNFLRKCNPGTLKIGLSFFNAEAEILGITNNDVKLDFCVTPNKTYKF